MCCSPVIAIACGTRVNSSCGSSWEGLQQRGEQPPHQGHERTACLASPRGKTIPRNEQNLLNRLILFWGRSILKRLWLYSLAWCSIRLKSVAMREKYNIAEGETDASKSRHHPEPILTHKKAPGKRTAPSSPYFGLWIALGGQNKEPRSRAP